MADESGGTDGRVRIRVPDGAEVEICDIQGCITVFNQKSPDPTQHDVTGDPDDPGPGWVAMPLLARYANSGLIPIGTSTSTSGRPLIAVLNPEPETEPPEYVAMPMGVVGEPYTLPLFEAVPPSLLAAIGPSLAVDDTVHVVAAGGRVDFSMLAPLQERLSAGSEIAITMIDSWDD